MLNKDKSNKVIIGIDVGGSTTKIVGFCGNDFIKPIFVTAADPVTSTYGAFGKFLNDNNLSLTNINKVMITGTGSSHISSPIYDLNCYKVDEFQAIGIGGLYLSGLKEAVVASLGTGTALVHACEGKKPVYLGGTGVGGGTLVGLSKMMLGMDTIKHIEELATSGDTSKVNLLIGDLTSKHKYANFTEKTTASNFGKISDIAEKSDIALGIITMVFETIGVVSRFAAESCSIKDIILTGNLSTVSQAKEIFDSLKKMYNVNYIIPEYSAFGTVIGAALSENGKEMKA